jgi:hypothetical protein
VGQGCYSEKEERQRVEKDGIAVADKRIGRLDFGHWAEEVLLVCS